jgi:hypothetical protein
MKSGLNATTVRFLETLAGASEIMDEETQETYTDLLCRVDRGLLDTLHDLGSFCSRQLL